MSVFIPRDNLWNSKQMRQIYISKIAVNRMRHSVIGSWFKSFLSTNLKTWYYGTTLCISFFMLINGACWNILPLLPVSESMLTSWPTGKTGWTMCAPVFIRWNSGSPSLVCTPSCDFPLRLLRGKFQILLSRASSVNFANKRIICNSRSSFISKGKTTLQVFSTKKLRVGT